MLDLDYLLIETDRLWLRPIEMKDSVDVFKHFTETITEYMYPKPNENLVATDGFIRHCMMRRKKRLDSVMVIIEKASFQFIGICGIHHLDTTTPEFGIWIREDAFGFGYGREAVTGIYEAFDETYDFDYFKYPVDRRNISSQKIAQSLNGVIKKQYDYTNEAHKILHIDEYHIPSLKDKSTI